MADSPAAPESSPSTPPPSSPRLAPVDESTPLLPSESNPRSEQHQNTSSSAEPAVGSSDTLLSPRGVLVVTGLSAVLSSIALVLIIAIYATVAHAPSIFYFDYQLRNCISVITAITLFAGLVSSINLIRLRRGNRTIPSTLNVVCDIIISFYAIASTSNFLISLATGSHEFDNSCGNWGGEDETRKCEMLAGVIKILAGVTAGTVFALGMEHLILFVMRCVAAYRARFWQQRTGSWRIPTGRLSIEFTIKLLRQEEAET